VTRLAASVPGSDWEERFQRLQELDIDATGVGIDPDASAETRLQLRAIFERRGVAMVQTSCYVNLESVDDALLQANRERLRRAIAAAAELGAECVVTGPGHMHPGRADQVYAAHPDNWTPRAMDRLVASCETVLPATEGTSVKLCIEPWSIHTLNSAAKLEELIRRVNHPALKILLDPVNLMDLQTYFRSGDVINECFDRLGDAIWIVHAKDTLINESAFTYHLSEAVPGRGILDYPTLLRRMRELHPEATLFVEHLQTMDEVREAVGYIRRIASMVKLDL
jgi:sugar phosphate isomerase/epimerase